MINDISKSIKASLYERVTSPLFGAFFISWCMWNYKTILIIASSLDVKEKISYIDGTLYPNIFILISICLFYPLVSSLAFIFIYPYPAKFIYKYWSIRQKELKNIKQEIDDQILLTIDESRNIRREILKLESEYDSEIQRKNSEISRLKEIISESERNTNQDLEKLNNPVKFNENVTSVNKNAKSVRKIKNIPTDNNADDNLDNNQISIMKYLANKDGWINNEIFFNQSNLDRVKAEYYLEDLENKRYVRTEYNHEKGGDIISLTTKGKKFAIDQGLI